MKRRRHLALGLILSMLLTIIPIYGGAASAEEALTLAFDSSYDQTNLKAAVTAAKDALSKMDTDLKPEITGTVTEEIFGIVKNLYTIMIADGDALINETGLERVKMPECVGLDRNGWSSAADGYQRAADRYYKALNYTTEQVQAKSEIYTQAARLQERIAVAQAFRDSMVAGTTAGTYPQNTIDFVTQQIALMTAVLNSGTLPGGQFTADDQPSLQVSMRNATQYLEQICWAVRTTRIAENTIPKSQIQLIESSSGTDGGEALFDSDPSTNKVFHGTRGEGSTDFLEDQRPYAIFDLGAEYNIEQIELLTSGNNSEFFNQGTFSFSTDNISYGDEYSFNPVMSGGFPGMPNDNGYNDIQIAYTLGGRARYIKLTIYSASYTNDPRVAEITVKTSNFLESAGLASRSFDGFNQNTGAETQLKAVASALAADPDNGWASGWSSDHVDFTALPGDDWVTGNSYVQHTNSAPNDQQIQDAIYRKVTLPMDLGTDADYYFHTNLFSDTNYGWFGGAIMIGDIRFNICANSRYELVAGGQTVYSADDILYRHDRTASVLVKIEARSSGPDKISVKVDQFDNEIANQNPGYFAFSRYVPTPAVNTTDWTITTEIDSSDVYDYIGLMARPIQNGKHMTFYETGYACVPVESIQLTEVNIGVNETVPVQYTTLPQYSAPGKMTMTVADPSIAKAADGKITGLKEGRTKLTVQADDHLTYSALVNVGGHYASEPFNEYAVGTTLAELDNSSDRSVGFGTAGWYGALTSDGVVDTAVPVSSDLAFEADASGGNYLAYRHNVEEHVEHTMYKALAEPIDFSQAGSYRFSFNLNNEIWYGGKFTSFTINPNAAYAEQIRLVVEGTGDNDCKIKLMQGDTMLATSEQVLKRYDWWYYDLSLTTSVSGANTLELKAYKSASIPSTSAEPDVTLTATANYSGDSKSISFYSNKQQAAANVRYKNIEFRIYPALEQSGYQMIDVGDGKVKFATTVINRSSEDLTLQILEAQYDASGNMVSCALGDNAITIESGEQQTLETKNSYDLAAGTVRYFVWDGVGSMKPIFQSIHCGSNGIV